MKEDIKSRLQSAFGNRLVSVILFGSRVTGSSREDSDLDVLVVLKGPVHLWDDTKNAVTALYDLQLELEYPIHPLPVDAEMYERQEYAFYRAVKEHGVAA